jgi:DNA-binding NtrC family response regulator
MSQTAIIVDDDPDNTETMRMFLQLEGFAVKAFHDFRTALDSIDQKPCIALIDFHIRGAVMTIADFVGMLRAREPELKIVIITGDQTVRAQCAAMNVDEVLLKPCDPTVISALVAKHCPRS